MTEPKFTKGPWRVSNGVNVMADVSRYVAATAGLEDRLRFGLSIETIDALNDEDAANARLIAAAPQLYEALKEARGWVVLAEDLCRDNSKALALIDAALFSATGEA